ncbi:hypothetical protein [Hymenobacter psychrophilus]|uniref:Uncharacterized protein n=1 Tax=Hymenobacter psychrophilus TaxID=651662 RepID=A0A1H3CLU8_9BACT|nr:hypothetical protein [Hymenobacter psychrophilus]SDX54564.1 hypothetical protein SAMN04488069_10222 [Hymenobacter psychrophilus]
MNITQNHLGQLELGLLSELAAFVVGENFSHHSALCPKVDVQRDVQNICCEEMHHLKNSSFYIARDASGVIQGSIRLTKWDYKAELPLQKIFDINPIDTLDCAEKVSHIWHIGRFATRKSNTDRNMFKKLMVHAVTPICKEKDSVAFAECDSKLLRVINLLGIETRIIGKSVNYLGSETIPISISAQGLSRFYHKNKDLMRVE